MCATRFLRISAANIGPNRFHQNRTVSWLMSIPRSARRSSTLRSDRGYLTYIITTRRMTSGELLKYRNGLLITQGRFARERETGVFLADAPCNHLRPPCSPLFGSLLSQVGSPVGKPLKILGFLSDLLLNAREICARTRVPANRRSARKIFFIAGAATMVPSLTKQALPARRRRPHD